MTRQVAGLREANEPCTEATFQKAVANLSTFDFVGLVEQFDRSLQVFLSRFGQPSVIYLDRGRGKRQPLPEQLAAEIKPIVTFDQMLYDTVAVPKVTGKIHTDLWVDSTVISVEPRPGQPIPFSGLDRIKTTLARRNFDLVEPLATGG